MILNEYVYNKIEGSIVIAKFYPGKTIDLNVAKKIVKDRLEYFNGKSYPVLIDCLDLRSISFTKEARNYFSKEEGIKGINAAAFLVNTYLVQFTVNIFITFNKPQVPIHLFKSKTEALEWLRGYSKN